MNIRGTSLKSRLFPVVLAIALAGCGALPVTLSALTPAFLTGAGSGIAYTVTNVAYKTFSYPMEDVVEAHEKALEKMGIEEVGRVEGEETLRITASTKRLKIKIDLESITSKTTKIKVNARKSGFLKDKATATEIIAQTEKFLEAGVAGAEEGMWKGNVAPPTPQST